MLFAETGYVSINKYGEELCGDRVEINRKENSVTMVLADGLGSGVKANILATLTSKILCTMIAEGMKIEDALKTIAHTLPVCSVRHIAYSTFTALKIEDSGEASLIQFDNPKAIYIHDKVCTAYRLEKTEVYGKAIYETKMHLKQDDMIMLLSDGVVHAGVGKIYNLGWQYENVCEFAEQNYTVEETAKNMALNLVGACRQLYVERPGDDATVAVARMRLHEFVNVMIGPPGDPAKSEEMADDFLSALGKRAVCGGTTSKIVADRLGEKVETGADFIDPRVPPTAAIKGIDLVTEGVLTISRVLEILQDYSQPTMTDDDLTLMDGASRLAKMLIDSTDIRFFVGTAVNPAYQRPDFPHNLANKVQIVQKLAECLQKTGKKVQIKFY